MSDEPPWSSSRAAILAVVAGVAVLVVVPLVTREQDAPAKNDDGPTLRVYAGSRLLSSGDIVRPGDSVRFDVRIGAGHDAGAHVTLVGVDGAGQARAFVGPAVLGTELTHDIVLDDVLGDERYVAFACVLPVPVDKLLAAASAERPGADGCTFDIVTAKKLPR